MMDFSIVAVMVTPTIRLPARPNMYSHGRSSLFIIHRQFTRGVKGLLVNPVKNYITTLQHSITLKNMRDGNNFCHLNSICMPSISK